MPVIVNDELYDFERYRSQGKQADEELLPEDIDAAAAGSKGGFVPNEMALDMLMGMGFPKVRCEKALHATGNQDVEAATGWLFEHMEDPDIDVPVDFGGGGAAAGGASGASADPEKVEMLSGMGFTTPWAAKALKETDGDMERAVEWLFSRDLSGEPEPDAATAQPTTGADTEAPAAVDSTPASFSLKSIVCHKGASIHAGHYVAFIKKPEGWVLFNDEKVALGGDVDEMKKFAYIYFFRRAEGAN